jgi:hypothetical protein
MPSLRHRDARLGAVDRLHGDLPQHGRGVGEYLLLGAWRIVVPGDRHQALNASSTP